MTSETAIQLEGVTKRFGEHTAVHDLHMSIPRGCIYGLLGPNGSGKTTTLRMIMGILNPDEGSVGLFGGDPDETRRKRVGYLPEERGVYRKMKVIEQLEFLGEIRGLARREAFQRADRWLDRLGLGDWKGKKIEDLSKGMQQKVQFIATVLHEPDLLILDEPFSGLDPINQDVLEDIVREFHRSGTTILFSTHLMAQAEQLCERVCLISKAEKVLDGTLEDLKAQDSEGVVAIEHDGPDGWIGGPEVASIEKAGRGVHVLLHEGGDHQAILKRGIAAGAMIHHFELVVPSLHEIFIRHAGAEAVGDAGLPQDYRMAEVAS